MPLEVRPAGALLLWVTFVLICAGLAYPTLRRYDPRSPRMNFDGTNALYHWQVTGDPPEQYRPARVHFRYRVLVPSIARPFYLLARNGIGTWDAGYFGLLIANSLLCASTAVLLFLVAGDVTAGDAMAALVAPLLYLLSFAVPNFLLAGLIDSGEACAVMTLTWCLQRQRWIALPLLGIVGALAKETFVPFSVAFAAAWMVTDRRPAPPTAARFLWLGLLALAGTATLIVVFSVANATLVWPWQLTLSGSVDTAGFLAHAARPLRDLGLLYFFGWLVPLGVWSVARCPRPWVCAVLASAATAGVLGAFNREPGIARSLFNIAGPLLSLASALTLARLLRGRWQEGTNRGY